MSPPAPGRRVIQDRAGSLTIDLLEDPLLRITFAGSISEDSFRLYLDEMDRLVARQRPCAILIDASTSGLPPATHRKLQADWIQKSGAQRLGCCVGLAFVMKSALIRGALQAILWLSPIPLPYTVVGSVSEAEAWLRERLRSAPGLEPPSAGDADR